MIAGIMGQEVVETVRQTAFVKCTGTCEKTKSDFVYTGVEDCEMMAFIPGGGAKKLFLWLYGLRKLRKGLSL